MCGFVLFVVIHFVIRFQLTWKVLHQTTSNNYIKLHQPHHQPHHKPHQLFRLQKTSPSISTRKWWKVRFYEQNLYFLKKLYRPQ